jgi:hypothetical protein
VTRRRVVLVGATGMFGARLAARLARWPGLELVLAARTAAPLEAMRARLAMAGAQATLSVAVADRTRPATVTDLAPWAVIDAAGPFQGASYELTRAVIQAGAHWIDLADARDYVAGFAAALDALAQSKGVLAVTAASSTPALSMAALARIAEGWREVRRAASVIAAAAQSPGLSASEAILSQAGRRVRCFAGGKWTWRRAWIGARRVSLPGLGRRLAVLADTPDLDALPNVAREEGLFLASIEPGILVRLLEIAAWTVRLRLVSSLRPLARWLRPLAASLAPFGARRGGMVVTAEGVGPDGEPRRARWSLVAADDSGPDIPSAPASAVLRGLIGGRLHRAGALTCIDVVTLDEILAELEGLPIASRVERWRLDRGRALPRRAWRGVRRAAAAGPRGPRWRADAAHGPRGQRRPRARRMAGAALPRPAGPRAVRRRGRDRHDRWRRGVDPAVRRTPLPLAPAAHPGASGPVRGAARAGGLRLQPSPDGHRLRLGPRRLAPGTGPDAPVARPDLARPLLRARRDLSLQRPGRAPLAGRAGRLRRPAELTPVVRPGRRKMTVT